MIRLHSILTLALFVVLAALLFSLKGWAEELDKSQSLTLEKDSVTSRWTATCDASVSGIDRRQIYSGRLLFFVTPAFRRLP